MRGAGRPCGGVRRAWGGVAEGQRGEREGGEGGSRGAAFSLTRREQMLPSEASGVKKKPKNQTPTNQTHKIPAFRFRSFLLYLLSPSADRTCLWKPGVRTRSRGAFFLRKTPDKERALPGAESPHAVPASRLPPGGDPLSTGLPRPKTPRCLPPRPTARATAYVVRKGF